VAATATRDNARLASRVRLASVHRKIANVRLVHTAERENTRGNRAELAVKRYELEDLRSEAVRDLVKAQKHQSQTQSSQSQKEGQVGALRMALSQQEGHTAVQCRAKNSSPSIFVCCSKIPVMLVALYLRAVIARMGKGCGEIFFAL
jgi:hypothetical protein